jgi:hypothetical protein
MRFFRGLSLLLLGVFVVSLSGGESRADVVGVRVETIPERTYLVRTATGSYRQHQTIMNEVINRAVAMGIPRSSVVCCTGIYPMDPDVTASESDLEWYVAVEVPPGTTLAASSASNLPGMLEGNFKAAPGTLESRALSLPPRGTNPYQVVTMPSTLAVTTNTTYSRIGTDALIVKKYIYDNGYVQTASTRTVMLAGDPNDPITQSIQIAFPVTTRGSVSITKDGVKLAALSGEAGESGAEAGRVVPAGAIEAMPAGSSLVDSPEKTVLYRTLHGSYAQQQQACSDLLATAAALGAGGKPCIRVELIEPDSVTDESLLEWRVATEVPAGKVPPAPYQIGKLPASKAVVKTTTLAQVPTDQLAMSSWLVVAGYVHAAPVRTTFLQNGSVRLEVPVQPRFRQLPAELLKAQEISVN